MRSSILARILLLGMGAWAAAASPADTPAVVPTGPNEFLNGHMTTVSANVVAFAEGDFNHDGRSDLALADTADHTVTIMLGKGNGLFATGQTIQAGNPNSVAAYDLNNDGNLDLVTVEYNYNAVNVLLGNGKGGFKALPQILIEGATGCVSAAIGDLNGDGKPDIAVACTGGIAILLGNGNGTFRPATILPTAAQSLFIADLRGNGKNDLLAAAQTYGGLDVLLGNGDGTFDSPQNYSVCYDDVCAVAYVSTGDFNGDGVVDVAVTTGSWGYFTSYSYVQVLLGNGDGTFGPATTVDTYTNVNEFMLYAADPNGDGKTDLVVLTGGRFGTGTTNGGTAIVYINNGNGTFQPGVSYATGQGSIAGAINDFNGDGKQDLAVLAQSGEGQQNGGAGDINVLFGNGDGTFQGNRTFLLCCADLGPAGSVVADLNGDGRLDLVFYGASAAYVFLGSGDGTFQSPVGYQAGLPNGEGISDLATGDFNGDGHLDLVAAGCPASIGGCNPAFSILLGYGDGTFDSPLVLGLPGQVSATNPSIAAADFNRDGKSDLAICGPSGVMILLATGDGNFGSATVLPTPCQNIFAGDFNNDKKVDLAVVGVNGGIYVMLGTGNGTFQSPVYTSAGASYASADGDFNRDGKLDLAIVVGDSINVFLGNGDGTFKTPPLAFTVGNIPVGLAAYDLNGDGILDLVAPDDGLNSVDVLLGKGDGTFGAPTPYTLGGTFHYFGGGNCAAWNCSFTPALADFNGDSAADIVSPFLAENGAPASLEIQLNTGGTFITLASSANPSPVGQSVTFTAAVTHSFNVTGWPQPAGSVVFKDGSTVIGTASLISGTASLVVSTLSAGSHSITATYAGNKSYNPHKSAALTQTVH